MNIRSLAIFLIILLLPLTAVRAADNFDDHGQTIEAAIENLVASYEGVYRSQGDDKKAVSTYRQSYQKLRELVIAGLQAGDKLTIARALAGGEEKLRQMFLDSSMAANFATIPLPDINPVEDFDRLRALIAAPADKVKNRVSLNRDEEAANRAIYTIQTQLILAAKLITNLIVATDEAEAENIKARIPGSRRQLVAYIIDGYQAGLTEEEILEMLAEYEKILKGPALQGIADGSDVSFAIAERNKLLQLIAEIRGAPKQVKQLQESDHRGLSLTLGLAIDGRENVNQVLQMIIDRQQRQPWPQDLLLATSEVLLEGIALSNGYDDSHQLSAIALGQLRDGEPVDVDQLELFCGKPLAEVWEIGCQRIVPDIAKPIIIRGE